ncbi:nucleoside/nucleotide kinase family protein [Desertivibrio insolitus]|uniref:nucleoside/nucleotide kinase family protein n=1 Tax=Herbiconiux sp. SYSU D00978 TaxID=2812562 RepID=UPI001A962072|nr:nucleoside/nucleotide kinase family protein [Herbiconiux sp. SYSU D00978]
MLTTLDEVAGVVTDAARGRPTTVIGIAGSPGSGKSTIAEQLAALVPTATVLPMDGFHLPQARLVELGRRDRMGAPDTFHVDGFLAVLRALQGDGPVVAPGFDRTIEEPVPGAITIPPAPRVVLVEGNYLLLDRGGWEHAAPLLDLALFVSVPRDIRLARLIARHERYGKAPDDARDWALGPDERNAVLIEPTAARADHVVALG